MKYLVVSALLTLFVLSEVFASSKILEGSFGYRHDRPISGQILFVNHSQNLLWGPTFKYEHISSIAYQDCFNVECVETQIDNHNLTHPSLGGIFRGSWYNHVPQSRNSIGTCSNQKFELYQPGNEFYIGVNLSLSNLQPSPMLKVKINNDLYQNKHAFDKGWHHLYTGILCYALGTKTKNKWVKTIGGIILADDLVQHAFRVQSPLHLLNNDLWRHSWYQLPTKLMDKIMEKK